MEGINPEARASSINMEGQSRLQEGFGLKKLPLPWINTSLMTELKLWFYLQPIFWVMGIELILPAVLAPWMLLRQVLAKKRFFWPKSAWILLIYSVWQIAHIVSIPRSDLTLFFKSQLTFISLICLFVLVYQAANHPNRWNQLIDLMIRFGAILIFLGTIFILRIWDGQFVSLIGQVLPGSMINNSTFFETISYRQLGQLNQVIDNYRVQSTIWHPSSYGTILLPIIALIWYRINSKRNHRFSWKLWLLFGLAMLNMAFTYSRTTFVSFAVMALIYWWLRANTPGIRLLKIVTICLMITFILFLVIFQLVQAGVIDLEIIDRVIYEFRPNSVLVRVRIYQNSFELIAQKPIWGWGTTVQIDNLQTYFSAGSHSDYLNALFLFGIPGLLLYLGFYLSIWRIQILGLHHAKTPEIKEFFRMAIALMAAINIRQTTSDILWDVYVAGALMVVFGLAAAAHKLMTDEAVKSNFSGIKNSSRMAS